MNPLQSILANKHTTISGLVYFGAKVVGQLINVWCPGHEMQVKSSLEIVEASAVGWGLIMAGDAKQSQKETATLGQQVKDAISTGDTSHITKPQENPVMKG